jgi:hypothetical protein
MTSTCFNNTDTSPRYSRKTENIPSKRGYTRLCTSHIHNNSNKMSVSTDIGVREGALKVEELS